MSDVNVVLRHVLLEIIMKSRLVDSPDDLDQVVEEGLNRMLKAVHAQDVLLTEKEVFQRFPFLSLIKLRNMRAEGRGPKYIKLGQFRNSRIYYRFCDIESWIVAHYQMTPFLDMAR